MISGGNRIEQDQGSAVDRAADDPPYILMGSGDKHGKDEDRHTEGAADDMGDHIHPLFTDGVDRQFSFCDGNSLNHVVTFFCFICEFRKRTGLRCRAPHESR